MSVDRRVVALGGGHGLSVTLQALRQLNLEPTAVVGTGDDGGSSGRLRADLGVLPPGDLRMAIAALADEGLWRRVLQHRFGGTSDVCGTRRATSLPVLIDSRPFSVPGVASCRTVWSPSM